MCKSIQSLLQFILIWKDMNVLCWKPDLIKIKSDTPNQLFYNSYEKLSAITSHSSPSMSSGTNADFGPGSGDLVRTHRKWYQSCGKQCMCFVIHRNCKWSEHREDLHLKSSVTHKGSTHFNNWTFWLQYLMT